MYGRNGDSLNRPLTVTVFALRFGDAGPDVCTMIVAIVDQLGRL
jgi:hypothetical protein